MAGIKRLLGVLYDEEDPDCKWDIVVSDEQEELMDIT